MYKFCLKIRRMIECKIIGIVYRIKKKITKISCYEVEVGNNTIDVVIPTLEKDLKIFPLAVEGIRQNVQHKIDTIYVVAPRSKAIEDISKKLSCKFIDERSVLGFTAEDFDYCPNGLDRSGWIFQQLLKLSGAIGENENFLVVDADTVILRKMIFLTDSKPIFYESMERHFPYYEFYRKLFGKERIHFFSFISHMTLFNKRYLKEMKTEIEEKFNKKWYEVILENLDPNEISCCAENETYPNWVNNRYGSKKCINFNRTVEYEKACDYNYLYNKYSKKNKSVSLHSWFIEKIKK